MSNKKISNIHRNSRPPKPVDKGVSMRDFMKVIGHFNPNKRNKLNDLDDLDDIEPNHSSGSKNNLDNEEELINKILQNKKYKQYEQNKKPIIQNEEDDIVTNKRLDKMYVKRKDSKNINKYLICKETNSYLPSGYRYAGHLLSRQDNVKRILYARKNEAGNFVVHCLGNKIGEHNNYDVYKLIDLTPKLSSQMMTKVRDGIELII